MDGGDMGVWLLGSIKIEHPIFIVSVEINSDLGVVGH